MTIYLGRTPSRTANDPLQTDRTITLVPVEGSSTSSIPNSLPSIGRQTVLVIIVVISFASTLPTSVNIIRGGGRSDRTSIEGRSLSGSPNENVKKANLTIKFESVPVVRF